MNSPILKNENCSREKIAAYLDGELESHEQLLLEKHLLDCSLCASEVNVQKQMFSALDAVFEKKAEIKLPENFAKVVAVRAESNVNGLRSKKERFRALFFCAALFLLILIGHGAWNAVASLNEFVEQTSAVLGFTGRLAYNLVVGLTVILRSVGNQPNVNAAIILVFYIGLFILPTIIVSRYLNDSNRF